MMMDAVNERVISAFVHLPLSHPEGGDVGEVIFWLAKAITCGDVFHVVFPPGPHINNTLTDTFTKYHMNNCIPP